MKQYLVLLKDTYQRGVRQKNRTGVETIMIPGAMLQFDLAEGFPILTTKKVNFNSIKAELIGFIKGIDNAKEFRDLGTKIWDSDANENKVWLDSPHRKGTDDLGRIYGVQWRSWVGGYPLVQGPGIDQLGRAVKLIMDNPESRRIIVTAWNPSQLDMMALPPCHLLYQFIVEQGRWALHCCMYMRSCDLFLGVPFNISSYALLLSLVAKATGYEPGKLTIFLADCHIYVNHFDQVREQLYRAPKPLPQLRILKSYPEANAFNAMQWLTEITPAEIELVDYTPHEAIKAPMAQEK